MINGITSGHGIHIAGGSYSSPYINMGAPSAGMTRYNGSNFEVYDGSIWVTIPSSFPQIELDNLTMEAIEWVRRKMEQEKRMLALAEKHPAVADALATLKEAEEKLAVVVALADV
jgi:hypothetical protein